MLVVTCRWIPQIIRITTTTIITIAGDRKEIVDHFQEEAAPIGKKAITTTKVMPAVLARWMDRNFAEENSTTKTETMTTGEGIPTIAVAFKTVTATTTTTLAVAANRKSLRDHLRNVLL